MKEVSKNNVTATLRGTARSNEQGAALVIGLMFLAILALVGGTAVLLTTTDIKIGANYKRSVQADNAAQAGVEEARARLSGSPTEANYAGDPAASPDPWWSAYLMSSSSFSILSDDREYSSSYTNYIPTTSDHTNTTPAVNSLQTATPYLVKIRHKREYDAEQAGHNVSTGVLHYYDNDGSTATHSVGSPGSIVYYGDDDPTDDIINWREFTAAAPPSVRDARPVEIVRAYGSTGNSVGITEIEARIAPLTINTKAVVYAKDNVTGNGNALSVNGDDQGTCGTTEPSVAPIYTYPAATTSTTLNGNPTLTQNGAAASPVAGDSDIDIDRYVETLSTSADIIITSDQNGATFGSITDYKVCYSDTSDPYNVQGLTLQNVTGYGTLLVKGDLTLGGGFTWHGLVLTTGVLAFNGGGGAGINIAGAVMANHTVAINGTINLEYDSCHIADALGSVKAIAARWQHVY